MIKILRRLFAKETWTEDDRMDQAKRARQLSDSEGFKFWHKQFEDRLLAHYINMQHLMRSGKTDKALMISGAIAELEELILFPEQQRTIASQADALEEEDNGGE